MPSPELPPPDPNDRTGPYVVRTWPEEGSIGFNVTQPLVLDFSEPVDPALLSNPAGVEIAPAAGTAIKRLDATRTRLELIYPGLERDREYALAVSSEVLDLSGNALDQDPLEAGNQSFVLRFRTAAQQATELGQAFPEVDFGGGAEVHGIYAYVLDRTNHALRIYDLSNPLAPKEVSAVEIFAGYPRDLEVISRFSYVRPQGARHQPPCGVLHPGEVPWTQGFTSTTSVNLGCASLNRTLVAVVGGLLRPTLTDGVASGASQYLRVYDVTDVRNVFLVNTANITLDPTALVGQLKWSPPSLSYVERSGTIDTVNAVNLQVFLFGTDLDAGQYETMPLSFLGTPGVDLNGDGSLTPSEAERVLAQADVGEVLGLRDRAMLEVLYSTGLRRHELRELGLSSIDYERWTLIVRQDEGKKDRVVPIGERAAAWVEKYVYEVRPRLVVPPDSGVLFLMDAGLPFILNTLSDIVRRYVDRAELGKRGSCHLFRHAFATVLLENGADIRHIQEMLGHAQLSTTQMYAHVSIRRLELVHEAAHPAAKLKARPADRGDES